MDDSELTRSLDADEVQKLGAGPLARVLGGQFRLISRIGQGGMGTVWLAEQLDIDRPVVVKLMHESARSRNPMAIERFRREAKAVAALNHPNIVQIFVFGQTDEGAPYLVMEHVAGPTLRSVLASGPLPEGRAVRIAAQIAEALAEAHHAGIVHRDLKPENVMIANRPGRQDLVKVLDFGIAKMVGPEGAPALTQVGAVFGTPKYMSPEQARGLPADPRSDLYSLGVLMHEMVTGAHPFDAADATDFMTKHVTEAVRAPSSRYPSLDLGRALERIIMRCLEKSPEARFPTALALHSALLACATATGAVGTTGTRSIAPADARPPSSRRRLLVVAALGLVLTAVAIAASLRVFGQFEAAPPTPTAAPISTSSAASPTGSSRTPSAAGDASSTLPTPTSISAGTATAAPAPPADALRRRGAASEKRLRRRRVDSGASPVGLALPPDVEDDGPEAAALAGALGLGLSGEPADDLAALVRAFETQAEALVPTVPGPARADSSRPVGLPDVMPGATVRLQSAHGVIYETSVPIQEVIAWYDSRWGSRGQSRLVDVWQGWPRLIIAAPLSNDVGFLSLVVMRSPYEPSGRRAAIIVAPK